MNICKTSLIGEVAANDPTTLPIFEKARLDYCCHGRQTLAEACAGAGVNVDDLLSQLRAPRTAASAAEDWSALGLIELCDHIEKKHHVLAREIFDRLAVLMPRILNAHADHHPEYRELSTVIDGLREEMIDHLVREERVLFPWLRRLTSTEAVHIGPPWSVKRPIDCMMHDHTEVAVALGKIRSLTNDYTAPADTCGSVRLLMSTLRELEHDTHLHIHKENNILFPAGVRAEQRRQSTTVKPPASERPRCGGACS
jgi:regulator of cell morphogenesis and NO signaling